MSESTYQEEWRETLRQTAEATRDHLAELWARIDTASEDSGSEEYDDALTELSELPLEIVWEKGEPFAVVLGVGGPHVEITGGGRSGGYVLTVYWSGRYDLTGEYITRTGEYFRELVEESGE